MKKHNNLLRVTVILLTLTMLLGAAACKDGKGEQNATETGSSTTGAADTNVISQLPPRDFNDLTVNVMTRKCDEIPQFDSYEIVTANEGDALSEAICRRNSYVEETYGIKLNEIKEIYPGQRASILALSDDDTVSYVVSQMTDLRSYISSGAYHDLYKSQYFELDKPWWHTEINESYSVGNKLFMTMNDYLLMYKQQSYCLFFNKTMQEDIGIDDLYTTVKNGEWTWDKMYDIMKKTSDDLDGDGIYELTDQYGYAAQYGSMLASVVCGDVSFSHKDENDIPVIDGNNKKHSDVLDKLFNIYTDTGNTVLANDYTESAKGMWYWAIPEETFNEGRAMFMSSVIRLSKEVVNASDVKFGIIPVPKYQEDQEHATFSELYNSTVFAIPITADFDAMSYIIEAMSVESYKTVIPAYYDVTVKNRYAPDDRDKEMLDVIFKNYRIDSLLLYNWMDIYGMYDLILINKDNTYESFYAGALTEATETLDRLVAEIGKLE